MLRRCAKVAAVEVSKDFGRPNVLRLEVAITGVDRLLSFKEEETRAGAVVCFNERYGDAVGIWDNSWDVHWEWVDPFGIYREHMDDKIGRCLRTVYGPMFPACG